MHKKVLLGAAALAAAAAFGTTSASAQATTSWSGAPETREGEQRFKVRGRYHWDIYNVDVDLDGAEDDYDYSSTGLRRARLGVEGRFSNMWRYKAEITLRNETNEWEDLFLEYAGDNFSIFLGNNKEVAPFEEATSSRFIQFNERSGVINAFDYGRLAGGAIVFSGANWGLGAAILGDSINESSPTDLDDDGIPDDANSEIRARFNFAPIFSSSPEGVTALHLGVHVRDRDFGDNDGFRYRARPSVGFGDRFLDTGTIDASGDTAYGAEVFYMTGPFRVGGEYIMTDVDADAGGDVSLSGGYVEGVWNITGERHNYNAAKGTIGRISPLTPFGQGAGAWQVAVRYDFLDLNDGGVVGGEGNTWLVGLNWFPHAYVGFKLNYSRQEIEDGDLPGNGEGDIDVISLRTQFDF